MNYIKSSVIGAHAKYTVMHRILSIVLESLVVSYIVSVQYMNILLYVLLLSVGQKLNLYFMKSFDRIQGGPLVRAALARPAWRDLSSVS